MLLLNNLRQRFGGAIFAVIAGIFMFICGAVAAFVISPQQALEWRRIQRLPQMDAASIAAAPIGEEIVISGTLIDNAPLTEDGLVAFIRDEWSVEPPDPDDEDDEPSGTWETLERNVPALSLQVSGGTIRTVPGATPSLSGSQHEVIVPGSGMEAEDFGDEVYADGTQRTRGFKNSDLVTVLGDKASTGDIAPKRLFGGDRVQLVDDIRAGARAAFAVGIGMMICAPIVAVGGVLASIFGRRR